MYRIIYLNGPDKGARAIIHDPIAEIGTDQACRLALEDEAVLPNHAVLERREDGVHLRIGTEGARISVNQAVVSTTKLEHNDEFVVGSTTFQYQVMEATVFYKSRKRSFVYLLSLAGVTLILGIQILVILFTLYWSRDQDLAVAKTETVSEPAGVAEQAAEEITRTELDEELRGAEARLAQLDAEADTPSPEEVWAEEEAERLASERMKLNSAVQDLEEEVSSLALSPAISNEEDAVVTEAELTEELVALEEIPEDADPEGGRLEEEASTPGDVARENLQMARTYIAANDFEAAEQVLMKLQADTPDYVPALIIHARLLERSKAFEMALSKWDEALKHITDPALISEVSAQRAEAERMSTVYKEFGQGGAQGVESPKVLPRRIAVGELKRQKLQRREGFEAVRLAQVQLTPNLLEGRIHTDKVQVKVQFFDRNTLTDDVQPSRVPVSSEGLEINGNWAANENRTLSLLYMVPERFRQKEQSDYGETLQFYGYVVRVFYEGVLQDEKSTPVFLLERAKPYLYSDS